MEFCLFGRKHILLLSELRLKLFNFLFLFLDDLFGLLTVLIQINFLKGYRFEIVVLVREGDIELHDSLSSFELIFQLVSDGSKCHEFPLEIP